MQNLRLSARPMAPLARWASAGLLLVAAAASAQTVYRIVGPDGRVSFSDRPPAPGAATQVTPQAGARAPAAAAAGQPLPYALQQVVNRFPVTLYTAGDCTPCDSARQLLLSRGVPFSERTVNSNEDVEALKRLSGENSLPFGSIGSQQIKGFSDLEWSQFLDAAGYPKTSQLPAQYRAAAPTPLVAARSPAPTAPATAAPVPAPAPARAAAPAPPTAARSPTGITF